MAWLLASSGRGIFAPIGKCAVQVPGTLIWECGSRQAGLRRGLLACIRIGSQEHCIGMISESAAFQKLPQFALLFQNGASP